MLPVGAVARNIVVVGGATAVGQAVIIVGSPILSRLYDPSAFGLLSVYAAVLSVLIAVSSLRFDQAIPISTDSAEAAELLALSVLISMAVTALLSLILIAFGGAIATALGAPALATFRWLLPVALLVSSFSQALSAWGVYERSFHALGRMKTLQGISQVAVQIILGLVHGGPLGLLVGDVAGRAAGIESFIRPLRATLKHVPVTLVGVTSRAGTHWAFARVMTVASLLNALSLQIPFLLIPVLFDLDSSGQYFLAYRVMILPASLVAAAVSQVFFGEASFRREDPVRLRQLARNAVVSLFVFSIPTYSIIAVAGPVLIQALFGAQWGPAGVYAQIMAPWVMLWSVASPISTLLLVGRRERESLAFTAVELLLKSGSLAAGAAIGSLTVSVTILTAVSIGINVAALWRFLRVASVMLSALLLPVARIFAVTLPSLLLVLLVMRAVPAATPAVCVVAWAVAFVLAARSSPEARALLSGADD